MACARNGSSQFFRTYVAMASSSYSRDEILDFIDKWSDSDSDDGGMSSNEDAALDYEFEGSVR